MGGAIPCYWCPAFPGAAGGMSSRSKSVRMGAYSRKVSAATQPVEIMLGQKAFFEDNLIKPAQSALRTDFQGDPGDKGSAKDSFVLARVPSRLRAACECKTGDQDWNPIYIDTDSHVTVRDAVITPSYDVRENLHSITTVLYKCLHTRSTVRHFLGPSSDAQYNVSVQSATRKT
jgi:hypothetical protein